MRGAEAACRALGPVEIRRHEVLDEAVAMIACMRACSGQGRVLVGGSPSLPLQDACLRVCGGRAVAATARFTETLPQLPAKKRHSCRMHALVCVGAMACALARRPQGSALPLAQQCRAQHGHGRTACMDAHSHEHAAVARPDVGSLQASAVYSFRFSRFRASSAQAPSASDLSFTTYPLRKIHSPDTCLPPTPLFRDLARSPCFTCEDRADRFRHERVLAGRCSKHLCAHVQQLSRTQGFEITWTLEPKA